MVILRPRALAWDLLPARWDGDRANAPEFCVFTRDEATGVARRLVVALEAGGCALQSFGDAQGECLQLWLRTEEFVWIVCDRKAGQGYRPSVFQSQDQANQAAKQLASILMPCNEERQDYYFNTQRFS